jgi:hypothetical protein
MAKVKIIDAKIKSAFFVFILITSLMVFCVHSYIGDRTTVTKYYLVKDYKGQIHLFQTLFDKPQKLFLWCCDCILFYAKWMGITYEELNIHLFVIFQPMLIIFLIYVSYNFANKLNRLNR